MSDAGKAWLLGGLALAALALGAMALFLLSQPSGPQGSTERRAARPAEPAAPLPPPEAPAIAAPSAARSPGPSSGAMPEGDALALLDWLQLEGTGPVPELAADAGRFGAEFAREAPEKRLDAGGIISHYAEHLADGVTMIFPHGTYKLDDLAPPGHPFPRDLTLAGAGMDRTLFVMGGLNPVAPMRNLTLSDCTVFTDNRPLINLPHDRLVLTLERVRVLGFDSGQAPSPALRVRALALRATECRFEGGAGRAPGAGTVIGVEGPGLIASFERCAFSFVGLGTASLDRAATLRLVDCRLDDLTQDPASPPELPGVSFVRTGARPYDPAHPPQPFKLDKLFPRWRSRLR